MSRLDCRQQLNINERIMEELERLCCTYSRLPHESGSMDSSSSWRAGLWEGAPQFSQLLCWSCEKDGDCHRPLAMEAIETVHCSWDKVVLSSVRCQEEEDTRMIYCKEASKFPVPCHSSTNSKMCTRSRNYCQEQGSTDVATKSHWYYYITYLSKSLILN